MPRRHPTRSLIASGMPRSSSRTRRLPRPGGHPRAQKLRFIAVAATGTNIVDLKACAERGIIVSNIRNYAINTVPEHTFALIFALRRSIVAYREAVIHGRWQEAGQFCFFDYPIRDLAGRPSASWVTESWVGGRGHRTGAACASSFPLQGHARDGPLYTPFDEVIRTSDIITLHCPLMPSTQNMISHREFAMMERSPLLINTARGGLVDEEALAEALKPGGSEGPASMSSRASRHLRIIP